MALGCQTLRTAGQERQDCWTRGFGLSGALVQQSWRNVWSSLSRVYGWESLIVINSWRNERRRWPNFWGVLCLIASFLFSRQGVVAPAAVYYGWMKMWFVRFEVWGLNFQYEELREVLEYSMFSYQFCIRPNGKRRRSHSKSRRQVGVCQRFLCANDTRRPLWTLPARDFCSCVDLQWFVLSVLWSKDFVTVDT